MSSLKICGALASLTLVVAGVAAAPAASQTVPQEVVRDLEVIQAKIVGLAQTVPENLYTWRPGEGVRSIGEVYMHIASANFRWAGMVGVSPPEGTPEAWIRGDASGLTRAQAVEALNASFDFMSHVVNGIGDVNRAVNVFGRQTNVRGYLLTMSTHLHEHLGQSIAYARTNGLTPPWNME